MSFNLYVATDVQVLCVPGCMENNVGERDKLFVGDKVFLDHLEKDIMFVNEQYETTLLCETTLYRLIE